MEESSVIFAPLFNFLPHRIALLMGRCAGGERVADVLLHLPTHGVMQHVLSTLEDASSLEKGTRIILPVTIQAYSPVCTKRSPYKIQTVDKQGNRLELIFFNTRPGYLQKRFPIGSRKILNGIIDGTQIPFCMIHPECLNVLPSSCGVVFEPVYPLISGLPNRTFAFYCRKLLSRISDLPEWLPESFRTHKGWPSWKTALSEIHNATKPERMHPEAYAHQRLFFDEVLAHQLALQTVRAKRSQNSGRAFPLMTHLRETLLQNLPFALTEDQVHVLQEIDQDLSKPEAMARLLQGDVGSGKTLVALLAMLRVIEAGAQAVLLAPTEVLARQHYETFMQYPLAINIALLVGKHSAYGRKVQQDILRDLASGAIDLVVGTHALLEPYVQFRDLGLVVIDEQHRFGVRQRLELVQKGIQCASLYLSATPIPRTLLLTEYGDLAVSYIRKKPAGRKPVVTRIQELSKIEDVITRLHLRLATKEEQAFWVCPLVDASEKLDLTAAKKRFEYLKSCFGERIGLLHGRLSAQEKKTVLEAFKVKTLSILVTTTVVEVGIDIPSATIMIIEHAERFGLAQLHQLRGRIGRGNCEAFCLLLHARPLSYTAYHRLQAFKNITDGLELAEIDLKLRGGGDLSGVKQSGFHIFKLGNAIENLSLLEEAHALAKDLLTKNPDFYLNPNTPEMVLLKLFKKDDLVLTTTQQSIGPAA
jgi:ATP-dependent DNA helicase RecG